MHPHILVVFILQFWPGFHVGGNFGASDALTEESFLALESRFHAPVVSG